MSGINLISSIKHTGIEWILGFGAIVLTWEGIISFWLGFAVTVLTIYKILLDIKINKAMLRSRALSQVSKKVSDVMPEQKQHESISTSTITDSGTISTTGAEDRLKLPN